MYIFHTPSKYLNRESTMETEIIGYLKWLLLRHTWSDVNSILQQKVYDITVSSGANL